jgi:hypothetical protein
MLSITSVVPSPCGYGHLHVAVGQQVWLGSQVIAELPAVPVVPAMPVVPPTAVPLPPVVVPLPALDVALPLPPVALLRLSSPLLPHAVAKAAALESSTATAQKLDFEEEVRMGEQITFASNQVNVRNGSSIHLIISEHAENAHCFRMICRSLARVRRGNRLDTRISRRLERARHRHHLTCDLRLEDTKSDTR